MPVLLSRRARGSASVDRRRLCALAERMLAALGLDAAELSILLTNDATMRVLNREHRNKDRPTDVLAFPLSGGSSGAGVPELLGDIVISLDTAERQARGRRRELFDEIRFLLAHGLLHLIGYDHATPAQKRRMDARTRWLVRTVGESAGPLGGTARKKTHPGPKRRRGAPASRADRPRTRRIR